MRKTAKNLILFVLRAIGRGLRRWLELLGEHPPVSRDAGADVWHRLQRLPHTRITDEVQSAPEERPASRLFLKSIH